MTKRHTYRFLAIVLTIGLNCSHADAVEIETFTQPYRSVDVPAAEMGVLKSVVVEEGTRVSEGQLLAQIDDRVLRSSLEIADAAVRAVSTRRAAEAELALCEEQLRSYRELLSEGNATQREVDRAETNFWQATTRMQTVREEAEMRELEQKRITVQLAHRRIESPLDGVVVRIEKEAGEFVSPTDPVVLRVVQLDRLRAIFSVPLSRIGGFEKSQRIQVRISGNNSPVDAVIETISPVADAESASVRVTVRIDNRDRKILSGVICRWNLGGNLP
ncbi:efflux RND transporter periplasmic adaptor subunit [Rhodopirellula sp. SWK7]|uniref:efflux RND transporter periplasmic adaptor subunit n=1 Tax=Rhodopirellula sp. SWK7 TaxID=595460 RepID=UPI0002BEB855|nr:efflux RND transporter periplasmic adaptor subunit [Rhodopirellula sp. SWK7]EMI42038.1 secretion protein HlyD family protein [Rhodopirellula sp. SWK7]